jgi:hypothetical protein
MKGYYQDGAGNRLNLMHKSAAYLKEGNCKCNGFITAIGIMSPD